MRRDAPQQKTTDRSERPAADDDQIGTFGLRSLDDPVTRIAFPDEELGGDAPPSGVLDRPSERTLALGANLVDT